MRSAAPLGRRYVTISIVAAVVLLTLLLVYGRTPRLRVPPTLRGGGGAARSPQATLLADSSPVVVQVVGEVHDAYAQLRVWAEDRRTVRRLRGDRAPMHAIATFADADYCHPVWALYKSVRRLDREQRYDFIVLTRDFPEQMMQKPFCRALRDQGAQFVRVPPISLPDFTKIAFPHWLISMQKISVLMLPVYDRVVFLDGDVVVTRKLESFFDFPDDLHFAAVVDQWDGCKRREVLNGGVWSFVPSPFLFSAMVGRLQYHSCLSKTWWWSDQELINCICGGAGAKADRSDIKCQLLNYEYGAQQKAIGCPEYHPEEVRAIHFIVSKPWGLKRDMDEMTKFWWCIDDGGSLDHTRVTASLDTCVFPEP